MKGLGVRNRLRALTDTALPSLRVIVMAYTGLIGVVAVVLVVSVAFLPVAPVLQEATQPAREAVGSIVQPATEAVANLIGGRALAQEPLFQFAPAPQVALASELTGPDAVAEDGASNGASDQSDAVDEPPLPSTPVFVARPRVLPAAPAAAVEEVPVEEPEQAVDATDRASVRQVADVVAEAPVQQAANVEAPRPLPPLPSPTETARQARARLDVENQAAIDAAKDAVMRRKAEDDAANQTAIDAGKAKAARAHAKSDANAANQPAIDAAKAPAFAAKVTSQPTPSTPTPAPSQTQTTPPTPTTPTVNVPDLKSAEIVDDQPIEDEAPMMLAADAHAP